MELLVILLLVLAGLFGETALYRHKGTEGLDYNFSLSDTVTTCGETLQFTEKIANHQSLPYPVCKAEIQIPNSFDFHTGESSEILSSVFSLSPHQEIQRAWQLTPRERGIYVIDRNHLVTQDLLGAVRLSKTCNQTVKITVRPKRYTASGLLLPKILCRQGETVRQQALYKDPLQTAALREYVVGDSFRQIAWKASAHHNKLLVRQPESVGEKQAVVLLNTETQPPEQGKMTQDKRMLEHTISVCAEVLYELFQEQYHVTLCVREETKQATAYAEALNLLAGVQPDLQYSIKPWLQGNTKQTGLHILITAYDSATFHTWSARPGRFVVVTRTMGGGASCKSY